MTLRVRELEGLSSMVRGVQGRSRVPGFDSSTVQQLDSLRVFEGSTVRQFDGSTVRWFEGV